MNGELAQCLALVVHGGRWLASGEGAPDALAAGSTFQHVRHCTFVLDRGRNQPPLNAASIADWLLQLRERGAVGLEVLIREGRRVLGMPSYHGASFSGSDQWAIVARLGAGAELWEPQWAVNTPNPAAVVDGRIWDVRYLGHQAEAPRPARLDAGAGLERVVAAAAAAEAFATEAGWDDWAAWLRKAQGVAVAESPDLGFHADVLPAAAPFAVRRLFGAAAQSWVFGGMGWWNDMGALSGKERRYERVTTELYDAVLEGLATTANLAARVARN